MRVPRLEQWLLKLRCKISYEGELRSSGGGTQLGQTKKEEFPGIMGNMLPGNSFPQICVVSVKQSVENG